MKKKVCVGILVVVGLIFTTSVYAQKAKSIIFTTMDVKEPYEVISLVTYRTTSTSIDDLLNGLKKEANKIKDVDAMVGIRCLSYSDYVYTYGTAVKFTEKK